MIDGMKLAEILMIAAHMEPEGEEMETPDKILTVSRGFYTMLRSFLRDHEYEFGDETPRMAFSQFGVPEQPVGTNVRVVVDHDAVEDFILSDDKKPSEGQ